MDASLYYYAYTRGLPSGAEHAEVGFVTPLCFFFIRSMVYQSLKAKQNTQQPTD